MESGLQHNWALAIFQRLVFGRNLFNFSRAALSTAKCVSKIFLNIKINMKRDHGRALTWAGQKIGNGIVISGGGFLKKYK